ncbi:glycosyltransferase [Flavobacterium oreochromis]|uniref:Glycosyltransferase n=1 Tax=Flavobacterium oreochromis TaxID=2906078 RepID=A0ABW8P7R0_9FLAO|nr:glycosyltransferase [Flavobacterium oreochromis]OWP77590.1 hypothetical protein BWG23_04445 [Flavobacterium oreochromis]
MVDILLATYNGEKYIKSQIYSLLSQTYHNWRLVIHDDGSTDATIAIIKEFQQIDNRIILVEDGITIGNAGGNFLHLLQQDSPADFFIFCDQDDIWFENKLEELINSFIDTKPQAVFCNGYGYSTEHGIVTDKITEIYPKKLKEQLFLNAGIQGCSLMFNKALKDMMFVLPSNQAMHDHFVTLFAITFGELIYLPKNLMLYRQFHEGKTTANITTDKRIRFLSIFKREIPVVDYKHYLGTRSFYDIYENKLDEIQKKLFLAYFNYVESKTLLERIKIIVNYRFTIYGNIFPLILKTIMRKTINK